MSQHRAKSAPSPLQLPTAELPQRRSFANENVDQPAQEQAVPQSASSPHSLSQLSITAPDPGRESTPRRPRNATGMPDGMKAGLESMSGFDLSDVRVHRNSQRPAQLGASAYAQGRDIHLARGADGDLAHEAWHVVQQRQGRVKPTIEVAGAKVNDDASLEREADLAGKQAMTLGARPSD